MMQAIVALVALTIMEIVLGIDNIVFISIATGKLPKERQALARNVGLGLAMGMRILLLLFISWIVGLKAPVFTWSGIGVPVQSLEDLWHQGEEHASAIDEVSVRDLILLVGGLYLLWSSVREIHHKVTGLQEGEQAVAAASFRSVVVQIILLDVVFSLDSVLTAIGMAKDVWVMIAAVVIAVLIMLVFSGIVASFVERHPTVKILALSFLLLIGVMLVAEGLGTHFDKGYVYFAMFFSLAVEGLNLRMKQVAKPSASAIH